MSLIFGAERIAITREPVRLVEFFLFLMVLLRVFHK